MKIDESRATRRSEAAAAERWQRQRQVGGAGLTLLDISRAELVCLLSLYYLFCLSLV